MPGERQSRQPPFETARFGRCHGDSIDVEFFCEFDHGVVDVAADRRHRGLGSAFQSLSIPTRPVGCGLISLLEKPEQQRVRIGRFANRIIGQDELS
jgi:hypothetical protein